jgi:hypothetical protein
MKTSNVSMRDFIQLFPKFLQTVQHFKRGPVSIIAGEAELFPDGPRVHYTHDLSTCQFIISYRGTIIHQQEACTQEEIATAFKRANEKFFLADISIIVSESISFLITEKGRRYKQYSTSKKAVKTNHRGQKDRWNGRKAMKTTPIVGNARFKGKPIPSFNSSKIEPEEFCELPVPSFESVYNKSYYSSLCSGMCVLIDSTGEVGAVSFNPHYLGCRVIHVN